MAVTMNDLSAHVREADKYLRAGECTQAAQSCLLAAGIARALYLPRVEHTLVETAANLEEIALKNLAEARAQGRIFGSL